MSDVDDELLALAGGGSSPASRSSASLSASPSPPPRTKAKKRAAPKTKARKRRKADSEEEDEDEDAEGEEEALYPLEGIYRDEADRERLLDMPEIDRETELAARREELSKRRQASDLAALYRSQQAASGRGAPSGLKKAKRAAPKKKPAKKARRKASDDSSEEESEEEEEEEDEEEEAESEYEETDRRKTGRLRKSIGASADKSAKLQELSRKRKAKASGRHARDEAPGRRRGDRSSSEDSDDESDDEPEVRSTKVVGEGREAKRIAAKEPWTMPSRETLNRCRVRRDDVAKVLFKKGFEAAIVGTVIRVSRLDDRKRQIYRTYEVSRCRVGDTYYDLGDGRAFTSIELFCTFGAETHGPFQLSQISNSAITEDEHSRYTRVQEALWQTKKRHGPSDEAVQDAHDVWLAFLDRLVLDQKEALDMVRDRKLNRQKFEEQQAERKAALAPPGAPPGPPPGAPPEGLKVAELNERNRKAEKERMAEVERRAALAKRAALGMAANAASRPGSGTATPANGASASAASMQKGEHVRPVENAISQSAQDIDVDLGDF